ncbi:MAG: hypothetical protein ACI4AN_04110 [Muribaculaceae bacterium]
MNDYREIEVVIDPEMIFRSVMAEYALISAGKSDEEMPMQYARCDMPGICSVLTMEELGVLCSHLSGYVESCDERDGGLVAIVVRIPKSLAAAAEASVRRRIEDYLVASVLSRCLVAVKVSQREYASLTSRSRASLRSLRQLLSRF